MRHRQAIEYLPDLVTDSLDASVRQVVLAHVDACGTCQDWLDTADLLTEGFSRVQGRDEGNHLDSDVLALCVVRPEELHEPDREGVRAHLERCSTCRGELELIRAAIQQARPTAPTATAPPPPDAAALRFTPRALAAILAILLLGTGVFLGRVLIDRVGPTEPGGENGPRPTTLATIHPEPIGELSGRDLDGTQVIDAEERLVVSKLTVNSGADVTFQAGNVVAFGDGFRVAQGARIKVGSTRRSSVQTPAEAAAKPRKNLP